MTLEPGYFRETWKLSGGEIDDLEDQRWILSPGIHELRFRTVFTLNWGNDNQQTPEIWSDAMSSCNRFLIYSDIAFLFTSHRIYVS